MHVRIRMCGKPDTIVVVESKLTKIDNFRKIIKEKFGVQPKLQRLFYGGKLLENGYTFHDYNIKLNDVIQLTVKQCSEDTPSKKTAELKKDEVSAESPKNTEYKDGISTLYEVGDLIDIRDRELGAWVEGKITRIVYDPKHPYAVDKNNDSTNDAEALKDIESGSDSKEDVENKSPHECDSLTEEISPKTTNKGIKKYFTKVTKPERRRQSVKKVDKTEDINSLLLYKVHLDSEEDDESSIYCKLKEIRPRARREIDVSDLKIGDKVMVNHNIDEPLERGNWYDFKVSDIKKTRAIYDLIGTLYLGPEGVPQNDTRIRVHDKIYAIEEIVPLAERTGEYKMLMVTPPEKRTAPYNCLTCHDDELASCKDCGCYLCSGKDFPNQILLCDECNNGYHMMCLEPTLTELPEGDWYCPSCKRDPNDVVAPGAAKQIKKTTKSNRDWGRGMACVGKTKTSAMPLNHFGHIPGIEVGMCWRFRIQLSETGVHRPPVSGIHGRDVEGAYSIVLSGGYEDDVDNGNEFTYTGSGGRDLSGNKRTAEQSCDQTLTRENKALARNCAVKQISEEGGDAGDDWREGKPVRVVRSCKMRKHFPKYAPKEGIRYDGIYKVVKYYPETGLSGYRVWKYLLRRDDPNPAPWEPEGNEYPVIYPDGYLEAEEEKKALKNKNSKNGEKNKSDSIRKKRTLKESNHTTENEFVPVVKKRKTIASSDEEQETKIKSSTLKKKKLKTLVKNNETPSATKVISPLPGLSETEKAAIKADTLNDKLWAECLVVCDARGKKEFVEHVTQEFRCIICQDVVVSPVTTPCLHNFCIVCLKQAFKASGEQCPHCRTSLAKYEIDPNDLLKTALRSILPGYDAGKK